MTEEAIEAPFVVRDVTPDDLNFIYSSWLQNYWFSSDFAKPIERSIFYECHHKAIERILQRKATVRVAVAPDAPDVIYGWAVFEGPALVHYVYVKPQWRRLGIARALLAGCDLEQMKFTHLTHAAKRLLHKWPKARYLPYGI